MIITIAIYGCSDLENPDIGIKTEQVLEVDTDKDAIIADSVSSLIITVLLKEASDPNKEIVFSTDHGRFIGAEDELKTLNVKSSGRSAEARLISGLDVVDDVGLKVKIGDFTKTKIVAFQPAYPDETFIISEKLEIKADKSDDSTITLNMIRNSGKVSNNLPVRFSVEAIDTSKAIAEIIPLGLSDSGKARTTLRSSNSQPGLVKVKAEVTGNGGSTLSKEIIINIIAQ